MTGIGFLGAGAIIRQGLNVRGLTTAAALWVTAAIGMAAAFGYWTGAIATTVLTVAALYGLKRFERVIFPRLRGGSYSFAIDTGPQLRLSALAELAEQYGVRVESMRLTSEEGGERRLIVVVAPSTGFSPEAFGAALASVEGVRDIEWSS